MEITYELYIPPMFFSSANRENDYESPSERIVKGILVNLLHISDDLVIRGNEANSEPDYSISGKGYEVTFGITDDVIRQLKGIDSLNHEAIPIEEYLIKAISESLERKVKKSYSLRTTLIVFCIQPFPIWYTKSPSEAGSDDIVNICFSSWLESQQKKRNDFFNKLFNQYVLNGHFEDILILQLTHEGHYVIYSINDFIQTSGENFMHLAGFTQKHKFPHCKVVDSKMGEPFSPIICKYNILYGQLLSK